MKRVLYAVGHAGRWWDPFDGWTRDLRHAAHFTRVATVRRLARKLSRAHKLDVRVFVIRLQPKAVS